MCGIAGLIKKDNFESALLSKITNSVKHRGPDNIGIYKDNTLGLGHRRLSIVDLSPTGHQPMASNDGNFILVFNGEIYNHNDLRNELDLKPSIYRGTSDSETILNAYQKWGIEALVKLNGVFALAIYDKAKQKLILARDRFGVKPLYYHCDDNQLVFGSEIKTILECGVNPKLNYQSLHEFLYYGYAMKERTMYDQIFKLLPGHYFEIDISTLKIESGIFWKQEDLLPETKNVSEKEAISTTRTLLENAVSRQLMSDVPVGVFLSGGVDSSAVTAFASKHYNGKLSSFSAGFDFDDGHNELPLAKKIADKFQTNHHEIFIQGGDLDDLIVTLVHHHDEPFSDAANIPLYLMTQEVKSSCKVILQGDGGDEIFGGYPRYSILENYKLYSFGLGILSNFERFIPINFVKEKVERFKFLANKADEGIVLAKLLTLEKEESNLTQLILNDTLKNYDPFTYFKELSNRFKNLSSINQKMLWIDTKIILPDQFLEKVDKSTMANAVEVRVPFLDNELTSFAMSLPSSLKVKNGKKKYLLKKALEGTVPNEVLYGPKKGFGVPYSNWIKKPLYQFMVDRIHSPYIRNLNLLNYTHIDQMMYEHKNNIKYHGFMLWKILNLCIWLEDYKVEI
jgi:asparagine synthase (glutamine-hydrolysing)